MRRREPVVDPAGGPPPGLARYRPEAYQDDPSMWTAAGVTAWLRDRVAWRQGSDLPLPDLRAMERSAAQQLRVPDALLEAARARPLNRRIPDEETR